MQKFDCQLWRSQFLWREELDILFTRLLPGLKHVYSLYIGKYADPATPKTMSLEEFTDMFQEAELIDQNFGQREIGPMYAVS